MCIINMSGYHNLSVLLYDTDLTLLPDMTFFQIINHTALKPVRQADLAGQVILGMCV